MGPWRGRRWQEFCHCVGLLRRCGIWRICGFIAGGRAVQLLLRFDLLAQCGPLPSNVATSATGGQCGDRPPLGAVGGIVRLIFVQAKRSDPRRLRPTHHRIMKNFSLIVAVCAGSLLFVFAGALASEDHGNFASCRANGFSVDACMLKISGR